MVSMLFCTVPTVSSNYTHSLHVDLPVVLETYAGFAATNQCQGQVVELHDFWLGRDFCSLGDDGVVDDSFFALDMFQIVEWLSRG